MQKSEDVMWKFPELNYLSGDSVSHHGSTTEIMLKNEKISELTQCIAVKDELIKELTAKVEQLTQENALMNQSKEKMYADFQDAVHDLFKQVKQDGLTLVSKLTRLLINREIKTDPNLVKDLLNHLLDKVTDQSQIFVEVSPADFSMLKDFPQSKPISLIENIKLEPGNIIIKQHHQGMIYDIDSAIKDLLGT